MSVDVSEEAMRCRDVTVFVTGNVVSVSNWTGRRYDDKVQGGLLKGDKIRDGHCRFRRSSWNRLQIGVEVYRQLRGLL